MNGYELGYRGLEGRQFYVDIAGFYNHYGDLFSEDLVSISPSQSNPPPTHEFISAQFGNGLIASTTGMEVAPEWRPTPWWRLSGSYSFLDMHVEKGTNSKDIGSAPTVQGSSPEHQALFKSGFDLPRSVSTDVQVRYVSALPGLTVPKYWTGDVTAHWAATPHIGLTAVGQNLFQPHHVEFSYNRILSPGGRIVILDLVKHRFEEARELYADEWMGFSESDLESMLEQAGFQDVQTSVVYKEPETPNFQTLMAAADKAS